MAEANNAAPKRYILNLSIVCSFVAMAGAIWLERRAADDYHGLGNYSRNGNFHVSHFLTYWFMLIGVFIVLIVVFTFLQKFLSKYL